MWIERYTANNRTYYRARAYGSNPIHLGTVEHIVRKVTGVEVAKRTIPGKKPTKKAEGAKPKTHEKVEEPEKAGLKGGS